MNAVAFFTYTLKFSDFNSVSFMVYTYNIQSKLKIFKMVASLLSQFVA